MRGGMRMGSGMTNRFADPAAPPRGPIALFEFDGDVSAATAEVEALHRVVRLQATEERCGGRVHDARKQSEPALWASFDCKLSVVSPQTR